MIKEQHYKAIAEIVSNRFVDLAENAAGNAVKSNVQIIAADLADYFATDNPRFDRKKFLTACDITDD